MDAFSGVLMWVVETLRGVCYSLYQVVAGQTLSAFIDLVCLLVIFLLIVKLMELWSKWVLSVINKFNMPNLFKEKFKVIGISMLKRLATITKLSIIATALFLAIAWVGGIYLKEIAIPTVAEFQVKQSQAVAVSEDLKKSPPTESSPSEQLPSAESQAREALGQMGDFFGGMLNPILAFVSFIALLYTIRIQSYELEMTRKELERSASAQESTEKVLKEQVATQIKQQFEGTFFAMLGEHNKSLEKLNTPNVRWTHHQTDLEIIMMSLFSSDVKDLKSAKATLESKNELCGHYLRVLYQLLKFLATNCPGSKIGSDFESLKIKEVPLSQEEKMYSNIVRSFLGYNITQVLAINCFCTEEHDSYWKFRLLLERYEFLEHMPFTVHGKESELLLETKKIYKNNAFGRSDFI